MMEEWLESINRSLAVAGSEKMKMPMRNGISSMWTDIAMVMFREIAIRCTLRNLIKSTDIRRKQMILQLSGVLLIRPEEQLLWDGMSMQLFTEDLKI